MMRGKKISVNIIVYQIRKATQLHKLLNFLSQKLNFYLLGTVFGGIAYLLSYSHSNKLSLYLMS